MLRALVRFSLQQRFLVVAAACALVVAGAISIVDSPLDVFPEFAPPLVEVQVEAPGMSSESVERLITVPLEAALNGVPRMTVMRSKSVQGLSAIQLLFEQGSDLFRARQMVSERVTVEAVRLPKEAKPPRLLPPLSSTSRILKIGLTPKKKTDGTAALTTTDISVLWKRVIEPRLRAVPGVANVSTYGVHERNFQILVDPAKMRDKRVTLDQIKLAVRRGVVLGSAGYHDTPNQRLAIQYATKLERFEDLGRTAVTPSSGEPVRLDQVARLAQGTPPSIGEGVIQDQVGLLVVVEKFPWSNTLQVTRDTEAALDLLRPGLSDVEIRTEIFRPASFIERAIGNLRTAMLIGCVLVALIVIAFLFEWRTAFISLTAIRVSILAALLVLRLFGMPINTMVLAGLAIAVGEVVDDAIIDVENIVRRLRENQTTARPRAAARVVLLASLEVRSAVVYATCIVALVCLPIFFLGGVAGSFFRPLATAYILSVLASLLVALTVTPALCLILLPQAVRAEHESFLARIVKDVYRRILPPILNWPIVAFAALALLLVVAAAAIPGLKDEYMPKFQETDFLMHWVAKPGTSLDVVTKDIQTVAHEMLTETPVREFGSHIARAEVGEEVVGPNFAELWVSLKPDTPDYSAARKQIEEVMDRHPGFEHDLLTYLQERIKEVLSGTGASVVLRIYGPDLAQLRAKAQAVRAAIEGYDGR